MTVPTPGEIDRELASRTEEVEAVAEFFDCRREAGKTR